MNKTKLRRKLLPPVQGNPENRGRISFRNINITLYCIGTGGITVGAVIRLRAGQIRNGGSIPYRHKRFFFSSQGLDRPLGSPSHRFNVQRRFLLRDKAGRRAKLITSTPPTARGECRYTSTPYSFMLCTLTILPFSFSFTYPASLIRKQLVLSSPQRRNLSLWQTRCFFRGQ